MSQLRQRPLDAAILEALRHHCESAKDPGTWAEALEHHARAAEDADADPIALGRLHYELGNLYRDHLRRLDRAVLHYRSAADNDPAQRPAMAAARALFADAGNWDQVAKLAALEAESLPRGQKRAQLLADLAEVQRTRLDDIPAALETLREAVLSAPSELGIRHQLATSLLELADRDSDAALATTRRTEAADTLAEMAKRVSDDYAFAYAEAALDAAPVHAAAMDVLESVAPRIGREDAVATRWVAALQHAPTDAGARQIRLKLARAYELANQLEDARICLEPIATVDDPEARAMLAGLGATAAPKEFSLFESDDPFPEGAQSLAEELGAMLRADDEAEERAGLTATAPLSDLSALAGTNERGHIEARPSEAPRMLEPGDHDEEEILTAPGMPEQVREALESSARAFKQAARASVAHGATEDALADEATGEEDATVIAAPGWAPESPQPTEPEYTTANAVAQSEHVAAATDELEDEPTRITESPLLASEASGDLPTSAAALDENDLLEEVSSSGASALAEAVETAQGKQSEDLARVEDDEDDAAEVNDDELMREPTAPRTSLPQPLAASAAERSSADATLSGEALEATEARISGTPAVVEPAPLPEPVDELTTLRADLERRLKFRDRRGAAEVAERIIQLGGLDRGAVAALEEHYRTTRDFRRMRDLALRIAGEPEVDEEERVSRLREAAMLSESKLGDVEGTARALVGLLALQPLDEEAYGKLKRMFLRLGRFDDLATLYAQTAEALPTSTEQAARYRELFALHRDKRRSGAEAIEALERVRQLDPGDATDDSALYDLYRSVGRHADAAVLLRTRIDAIEEPVERVPLLAELAELVEAQLHDVDAAYEANAELLRIAPRHAESLDRAARIETSMQRYDLLVETLRKQLESAEGPARLPLIMRIADVTMGELSTPAEAAEVLSEALSITPQDRPLWQKAAVAFDAADRAAEFDERLNTVLSQSRDAALRFDAGAMLAERRELADDLPAAIAAREAQLAIRREEGALTSLVSLLRRADRPSDLARRLDDLARMVAPEAARGLRLERAALLGERLQNPEAAKSELERILSEIAPDDAIVLAELVELARRTDDIPRRVRAQERLLVVTRELEQRIELAEDLVEVYERQLGDVESALRVLRLWCEFDRSNPRPRIRLLPLLEGRGERAELVSTLDALAALAIADDEAGEYVQRAARVAMELGDYDGAWNRLVPRVVEAADAGAEVLLTQLALRARRGEQLAELYVGLAQRAEAVDGQKARWTSAARVYDTMVGDPARALEAALRAFAKDLDDPALLSDVDRLAEAARADKRLTQVYDSLVRRATSAPKRAELLLRHARLLEERLGDLPQALERASLAFQVDPTDERAYNEGIRLAERAEKPGDALRLHELRAETSRDLTTRVEALVAACGVAASAQADGPRAVGLMERLVALAYGDEALLDRVERGVAAIHGDTPAVSRDTLLRALAGIYDQRASELRDAKAASDLYARAARTLDRELGDASAAFAHFARASKAAPERTDLLDELGRIAPEAQMPAEFAAHLDELARAAIDSNTAVEALRRLAALYEGPLANAGKAADAYEEELKLRPADRQTHASLRRCLREAGRYKELLVAIDREITLESAPAARAALLCESAETWELALRNRFEARDAYRKALALVPHDATVQAALERLSKRSSVDDAFLLDGDLTVRPEDLRPSLPEELPVTELSAAILASAAAHADRASHAGDSDAHAGDSDAHAGGSDAHAGGSDAHAGGSDAHAGDELPLVPSAEDPALAADARGEPTADDIEPDTLDSETSALSGAEVPGSTSADEQASESERSFADHHDNAGEPTVAPRVSAGETRAETNLDAVDEAVTGDIQIARVAAPADETAERALETDENSQDSGSFAVGSTTEHELASEHGEAKPEPRDELANSGATSIEAANASPSDEPAARSSEADENIDDAWTAKIRIGAPSASDAEPAYSASGAAPADWAPANAESAHHESTHSEPALSAHAHEAAAHTPEDAAHAHENSTLSSMAEDAPAGASAELAHAPADVAAARVEEDAAASTDAGPSPSNGHRHAGAEDEDDLASLDDDIEELDADELDLSADDEVESNAAAPDGLDALSGMLGRSSTPSAPTGRKVPPPPPRASGTGVAPQAPAPPIPVSSNRRP